MPIAKLLKRDSVTIGLMLHAQQNDERPAEHAGNEGCRRRLALHFEVVWSKKGKENPMAGAARRKREPARLEGLTFPVLVDSETPDLRFKRLPRNSEFCCRA